jgi:hypothetical protein
MTNKYFTRVKDFLYEKNILPLIITENSPKGSNLDEMAELMKPIPYEQIAHKLPIEFGKAVRFVTDPKNYQ